MAHHTHFMQTRLSVKQDEARLGGCETGLRKEDETHGIHFEPPAIYTYTLQDMLHFPNEA